jgi:acyl carrier protein
MEAIKFGTELSASAIGKIMKQFIIENYLVEEPESLSEKDSLLEKGIIDSTGILEMVAFIEQRFGFDVLDHELVPENLDTIADIIVFVNSKLSQKRRGEDRNVASSIS